MFKMATSNAGERFRFAIDRGGTFTDVYAECPKNKVRVMKLLSVDPAYPDAPREGIRRILEEVSYIHGSAHVTFNLSKLILVVLSPGFSWELVFAIVFENFS